MTTKDLLRILWQIDGVTRYNTLIYWLQKLPLIGRRIPQACYRLKEGKVFLTVIHGLIFPFSILAQMALYVGICFTLAHIVRAWFSEYTWYASPKPFTLSLLWLVIFSLLLMTTLDIKLVTRDDMDLAKAIRQFHLLPRDYLKAKQLMRLGRELLFHVLALGIYFTLNHFTFWPAISFTLLVSGVRLFLKVIFVPLYDRKGDDKEKYLNRLLFSLFGIAFLVSGGLLVLGNRFAPQIFFSIPAGCLGFVLWGYGFYRLISDAELDTLTRSVVTHETMKERVAVMENVHTVEVAVKEKDIDLSPQKKHRLQGLTGIAYLNAIFLQRMGKRLRKGVTIRLLIVGLAIVAELIGLYYFRHQLGQVKHQEFVRILYVSLVSGYLIYVGESYIKFCFYHLDRPLLKFNDYRQREVILATLKTRFWSIIKHNIPIFVAANLFVLILYVALFPLVWTEMVLIVMVQFLSMSFFSLYFLYLYFLLQPFTEGLKSKNVLYNVLTFIVYYLVYQLFRFTTDMTMPIFLIILFGMILILGVGYLAVYYLAPKTFRLK